MYKAYNMNNLKKKLEKKFLFEDDLLALYLMLDIVQQENKIQPCYVKYNAINKINNVLNNHLSYRNDKENIIKAVFDLISEDINKIEFTYYLQAYTEGFNNKYISDELEFYALRHIPASTIKKSDILLHNTESKSAKFLKNKMISSIKNKSNAFKVQDSIIDNYCENILKDKLLSINSKMDKQLVMKSINDSIVISEEKFLNMWQLENLYKKIVKTLKNVLNNSIEDALWYGLNDRVLQRYK